jgi:hypothetical protein
VMEMSVCFHVRFRTVLSLLSFFLSPSQARTHTHRYVCVCIHISKSQVNLHFIISLRRISIVGFNILKERSTSEACVMNRKIILILIFKINNERLQIRFNWLRLDFSGQRLRAS